MAARPFFSASSSELRAHAFVLAIVLWSFAVVLLARPGRLDTMGKLKGRDFAYFYTLGAIVDTGETWRLYDMDAEHELRVQRVPESETDGHPSSYPPQVALVFAPLALFSYGTAYAIWAVATLLAYGVCAALFIPAQDRRFWWPVVMAFPPLWFLVLGGQSTTIPLLGFGLGTAAMMRGRLWLAGMALGLVAMKPQLGLALAAVLLACREWRIVGGLLTMVGAQCAAVTAVLGFEIFARYAAVVADAGHARQTLKAPAFAHSLIGWTDLAPAPISGGLWIVLVLIVLWRTVRAWRAAARTGGAMAVVVLASVLVSPHLRIYDLTLLMPAILVLSTAPHFSRHRPRYGQLVYALYLVAAIPVGMIVGLQLSVAAIAAMFWYSSSDLVTQVRRVGSSNAA